MACFYKLSKGEYQNSKSGMESLSGELKCLQDGGSFITANLNISIANILDTRCYKRFDKYSCCCHGCLRSDGETSEVNQYLETKGYQKLMAVHEYSLYEYYNALLNQCSCMSKLTFDSCYTRIPCHTWTQPLSMWVNVTLSYSNWFSRAPLQCMFMYLAQASTKSKFRSLSARIPNSQGGF